MTTQIEAMKMMVEAITEMNDLISETSGVYGLHLNGDPSPWGEIEAGGRFERLTLKDDALAAGRAAIEAAEKVEPCGKIVKATGSLKDMHIITWEDWYRPECGDKLYTNPPSTEIEELRKNVELANKTFAQLIDWCRAYPVDVFIDPDWDDVKEKLGATLLTQVSAANFRHVLKGVEQIIIGAQGSAMQEKQP